MWLRLLIGCSLVGLAACGARAALPVGEGGDAGSRPGRAPFPCIWTGGPEVSIVSGELEGIAGAITDDGTHALVLALVGDGTATGALIDLTSSPFEVNDVELGPFRGRVASTGEGFVHFDATCDLVVRGPDLTEQARDDTVFTNCDLRRVDQDTVLLWGDVGGDTLYARRSVGDLIGGPFQSIPLTAFDMGASSDGSVFGAALYPDSGRTVVYRDPPGRAPERGEVLGGAGAIGFGMDPTGLGAILAYPPGTGPRTLVRIPAEGPLDLEPLGVDVEDRSHLGATDDEIVVWPGGNALAFVAGGRSNEVPLFDGPVDEVLPLFRQGGVEGGVAYLAGENLRFRALTCNR